MKLPNAEHAIVDLVKLTDYCLSKEHPRGKHKARVFESACGLTTQHAELLRQQLLDAAEIGDAVETSSDAHGRRFVLECRVQGPSGEAAVRTAWILLSGEDIPRFVSAYVI